MQKIIRLPEVLAKTGLTRASVYRLAQAGKFPSSVKLSERSSGWRESEVDSWVASRQPPTAEERESMAAVAKAQKAA